MKNLSKLDQLFDHISQQETAFFSIVVKVDGDVTTAYEWGREAPDSPMVAAASYGIGDTVDEALQDIYKDLGIT